MLTKCPECELQISDKAVSCPHCGFPMARNGGERKTTKKRRRLPNGFGRITKISNQNLRNPYRVTVSVGKTPEGRPIGKLLKPQAYFKTYNEAYEALVEYNRNPCSLDSGITVKELYDRWSKEHDKKITEHASGTLRNSFRYCSAVQNMRVVDIRVRHIRMCMEEGYVENENGKKRYASSETQKKIKSLWNQMLDYAVEYEIVKTNYARIMNMRGESLTTLQETAKRGHMSFSAEEMQALWSHTNMPYVKVLLVQCYSGWRPDELVKLRIDNINFDDWTIRGGNKTEAGIDRTVPIHSAIRGFVKELYEDAMWIGSDYLLNSKRKNGMTYDQYYKRFKDIVSNLNLNPNHRPHDGRKSFVTMAKEVEMNEYAIKRIVGHAITDLTESTYTDRSLTWLSSEIEKIEVPEKWCTNDLYQ